MRGRPSHIKTRRAAATAVMTMIVVAAPTYAASNKPSFVEAAMQSGLFKTFIGVIGKAKAEDSLNSGPVTVFMPTDRAFALLTQAQRDVISALSPDDAQKFINHFIIPGVALATNDIDQDITAVDGTSYNVTWYQGRLSLRDHQGPAKGKLAFVVNGDNPAGQGVLNAIDAVLLPVSLESSSETETAKVQVAPTNEASAPKATPADASPPSVAAPVAASSTPRAEAASAPQISAPSGSSNGTPSETQPLKPAGAPIVSQPDQAAASVSPITVAPVQQAVASPLPVAPSPVIPPAILEAPALKLHINVATADIRAWQVKTSSGTTGKVDRIMVGIPDGHITGIMAHFGGYFGFGGRQAYIPWRLVISDPQRKVLQVRMTADDLKTAPSSPPPS